MRYVPRLHVITHERPDHPQDHLTIARAAYDGGAGVVQLRDKSSRSAAARLQLARELRRVAKGRALIINDRADIAAAVGAGVHVGDDDLAPDEARNAVGSSVLVGMSVGSVAEVGVASSCPVDYIGVGPVFATRSKVDAGDPLGLDGLRAIAERSIHPVIAIGGIDLDRIASVMAAGVHGVAVLSAVAASVDPYAATSALVAELERASCELP